MAVLVSSASATPATYDTETFIVTDMLVGNVVKVEQGVLTAADGAAAMDAKAASYMSTGSLCPCRADYIA